MLLAYIDEIGQIGAFVHPRHKRFSDSPAFGYGGFLIPEDKAGILVHILLIRSNSCASMKV